MATGTYSVRAYGPIARREQNNSRRRAGIAFGPTETIVTTEDDAEGAVVVTEEQLDAILADDCLVKKALAAPVKGAEGGTSKAPPVRSGQQGRRRG